MREFDAERTAKFFNLTYTQLDTVNTLKPDKRLAERDQILMRYILDPLKKKSKNLKVIDFGCGQGRLVVHLIEQGFDAVGYDKFEGMRRVADVELEAIGAPGRVLLGGVEEIEALPAHSCDVMLMMGVFQYMSDEEYRRMIKAINHVLRPGGCLAATFQNAFFDIFTFNKYTIDFLLNELLAGHVPASEKPAVETGLAGLMTNPEKPVYSPNRARDNVFVRLTNPLTIGDEMMPLGLRLEDKFFYDFHGLPPLLDATHGEVSNAIKNYYWIEHARSWQGHFMAGAFLAQFTKIA